MPNASNAQPANKRLRKRSTRFITYKWIIQEELRRYHGTGWSGTLCLLPFVLGMAVPQLLRMFDPNVSGEFGWFSLLGIAWIYIVQFRLYHTVNRIYQDAGMKKPLAVWWIAIPGLNLVVGLRQIHLLSEFWAQQQGVEGNDPIAKLFPFLSRL